MSGRPIEPIDEELGGLLNSERSAAPPAGALDRVWSRLAAVPVAGGGGKGGTAAKGGVWAGSKVAALGVAAFVAGGVVSGGLVAATVKGRERVVYVERAAPALPAVDSAKPAPSAPPLAVTIAPQPLAPSAPPPSAAASAPSLSRERALLDAARTALASGDNAHAMSLLEEHARGFAKPQLGEEREALAVQALVASHRYDDARARAARFRAAVPGSMFLPAIDATLESIP